MSAGQGMIELQKRGKIATHIIMKRFSSLLARPVVGTKGNLLYGYTEKPDTVRYTDTVRYKTYSQGCLNTPAREVSYTKAHKEGGISLAGVFKHSSKRGLYTFKKKGEISFARVFKHSSERGLYTY